MAQEAKTQASPLSTLMVAWVVVVGLAFAPIGAWYFRTHDIRIVIAFLGAAFLIGASLFVAMGLARLGAKSRVARQDGSIANLRARGALFGKR